MPRPGGISKGERDTRGRWEGRWHGQRAVFRPTAMRRAAPGPSCPLRRGQLGIPLDESLAGIMVDAHLAMAILIAAVQQ